MKKRIEFTKKGRYYGRNGTGWLAGIELYIPEKTAGGYCLEDQLTIVPVNTRGICSSCFIKIVGEQNIRGFIRHLEEFVNDKQK